jgi:hypothetical protein
MSRYEPRQLDELEAGRAAQQRQGGDPARLLLDPPPRGGGARGSLARLRMRWKRITESETRSARVLVAAARFTESILFIWVMLCLDWVFENPLCNVYFRCGCDWNWKGGWDRCNIHDPEAPHCPWCAARGSGTWFTRIYLYCIALHFSLARTNPAARIALPVLAYVPFSFLVAAGFKINAPEYPYFLWK